MALMITGQSYYGDVPAGDQVGGCIDFHDDTGLNVFPDVSMAGLKAYRLSDLTSITVSGGTLANTGGGSTGGLLWQVPTASDASFWPGSYDEYAIFTTGVVVGVVTIPELLLGTFSMGARSPIKPTVKGRALLVLVTNEAAASMEKIAGVAVSTSAAQIGANLVNVSGSPVSTSAAQIGANVVNLGGNAVQAAGGFQKVSAGTGTGQLNLASGRVGVNWADVANPSTAVNLSGTTVLANTTGDALASAIKLRTDLIPAVPAYGVMKNASFGPWAIVLRQLIDPTQPLTGASVTAERSLDGNPFADCVNGVTEIGSGCYAHTLAAADTNANKCVIVKYTAAGAITEFLTLLVTP